MIPLTVKVLITAALVAAISELGRRSTFAGALVASLPLTSLLAIVWLYRETGDVTRVATMASGIFWLVLPSLALFLVFPACIRAGLGFWTSLASGIGATLVAYGSLVGLDRYLQLRLFG